MFIDVYGSIRFVLKGIEMDIGALNVPCCVQEGYSSAIFFPLSSVLEALITKVCT